MQSANVIFQDVAWEVVYKKAGEKRCTKVGKGNGEVLVTFEFNIVGLFLLNFRLLTCFDFFAFVNLKCVILS